MNTWLNIPADSDFSIHNLPYGIFSTTSRSVRAGIAIGDQIIDLAAASEAGLLDGLSIPTEVLLKDTLNDFIALGKSTWKALRARLQDLLSEGNEALKAKADAVVVAQSEATMHLPVHIGDYTDFYSSIEHATNVGTMFRDPKNALMPNWKHLPVGYHGRASSIVVSGTPVRRPMGQTKPNDGAPVFGASRLLDFELEMAFIVGKDTNLGERVSTDDAEDHIFGMVLFNDWSARDIQKWEYVPLGPFLGKSFASSISPWIVTLDALDPFRVASPKQEPEVLPYLKTKDKHNFDINLEVAIAPEEVAETVVCRSNYKYMYWNIAQQLAHHTVNGCNIYIGDMCGSGTISGATPDSYGSMLELTWRGEHPLTMADGTERKFIADHDTVVMRAYAEKDGVRVGFGEVSGKILPAK